MTDTTELRQRCEREKQRMLSESDKLRELITNEEYDAACRLAGVLNLWLDSLNYRMNRLADEECP